MSYFLLKLCGPIQNIVVFCSNILNSLNQNCNFVYCKSSACRILDPLYQVPGYTLPTCMKCSEHLTSKFVSATYQSVREDAVSQHLQDEQVQTQEQNSSDILHSEIASQTERHLEKDENTSHINQPLNVKKIDSVPFDLERTLHNLDVDIVFNEEGSCPLCSKTFSRKSSLLTHIRNHSAERKYACAYCQKGFTQAANLRNHERIHTNDRPYVCGDCGKAFTQITNLNNHRRLHTGERPFVCIEPECGRSFAQVTNLNNHMKTHHKVQQYCCNQCSKKFTQVTSLNQHLQAHAGITGYYCPRCPEKTFKQQSQIHSHMKTHGLAFPYECQKCDEKFLQQAHLDQHNKMHDEFKFKCDMCPSSFNQDSLLKKHIQRHIDGRYITCPVVGCQQGFTAKQHLSKHLLTRHSYSELPPPKRSKKHQLLDYQQINIKSQNEVSKKKKNIYKSNVNLKYIGNLSNTMSSVTNEERSGTTHSSPTNSQEVVNENLKCNDCSLNFTDDNELREHIFYKHPERRFMQAILEENKYLLKIQNQFVCNICSNVFKSHLALVRHTAKFHAQFL